MNNHLIQLRLYQRDVIERARARLREGIRRLLIQAPTGAGKTHISSDIIRCAVAKGKRCLFLAHRRRLIDQKSERLRAFGVEHGILMAGASADHRAMVQVASRDTLLSRTVRNAWRAPPPADLVIVDEAHNCMSGEYQRLLAMYGDAVVIGLTATPARSDGRGLAPYYQALECTVPVSQLVREGWLVPVKCFAPKSARKGQRKLGGDPVTHWQTHAAGRPTVLFASKVAASRAAVERFIAAGVPAEHIDAHTPDGERDAVIQRLREGKTLVVCNVGVWTEGVDVPELSCCILLRLAGSYVLFAQAVGRVMRSHPGKSDAILLDHAGACLEHGLPDQDVAWTLDEEDSVDARARKARKDGERAEPICCPWCGFLFTGAAICPACGRPLPSRKKEAERTNTLLEEVGANDIDPDAAQERRVSYWHTCLRVMAWKGRTCGAAAQMYKGKHGVWPDDSFSNVPRGSQWKRPVTEVYPQYGPQSKAA